MDVTPFVIQVLDVADHNPDLPMSGEQLKTYAILAANRCARARGFGVNGTVWSEAYTAAYDVLDAQNRLHPEWEG